VSTSRAARTGAAKPQITALSVKWMRRPESFWRRWVDHGVGFTGYRFGPLYLVVERKSEPAPFFFGNVMNADFGAYLADEAAPEEGA
jgi:hypothetical protein